MIGRNLGARLELCLRSVAREARPTVYVDSASSDGSEHAAVGMGIEVLRLDPSTPLSASRGRNAGAQHLLRRHADLEFLQFVDGDCELATGWISDALAVMRVDPSAAIVCGAVSERQAGRNLAATLLDVDWRGPTGAVKACGGIFLARAAAYEQVGGFSSSILTGEEADLCSRLRANSWRVLRVDRPMCTHDAGIRTIRGWWDRAVRVGRTYAANSRSSSGEYDSTMLRRIGSAILWAAVMPVLAVVGGAAALWEPIAVVAPLGVLVTYAVQVLRVARRQLWVGGSRKVALQYGFFTLVAKSAHLVGCVRHWTHR